MQRRSFVLAGSSLIAMPAFVPAQAVEKPKLTLAVGGKNLLYYLPLTIAESLGFSTVWAETKAGIAISELPARTKLRRCMVKVSL